MAPEIRRVGQHPAGIEMAVKYRLCAVVAAALLLVAGGAFAGSGHANDDNDNHAQAGAGPDQTARQSGPQLIMPMMNSVRGRKLFASKGCVTCHSINGVGGEDAPELDANTMPPYMSPFDFAARMWRGASTMIYMQEELGEQIEFTGEELADIIAFVHDEEEQHKFSLADVPPQIMAMMNHSHGDASDSAAHADDGDDHADDDKDSTLIPAEEIGHGHAKGAAAHSD